MLKYLNTPVTFAEVPDEITLCINITGCPNRCPGCHSQFLWEDNGEDLTQSTLEQLIRDNSGVSCVCLMGGDQDPEAINFFGGIIKHSGKKSAWYSGKSEIANEINLNNFDYIKIGPYIEEKGGLSNPNTNQKLYKIIGTNLEDITYKFWKNEGI